MASSSRPIPVDKVQFEALEIDGSNYFQWSLDVEAHLIAKDLQDAIVSDAGPSLQQKAQALILLRHHLAAPLKRQYVNEANPRVLWDHLQRRFDHTRLISLPGARHDWINLRVQDHKSMSDYNGELFRITAELTICGHPVNDAEQIERTLSTMHPTNAILAEQYRNMNFVEYSRLIAHMLLAEKHHILLLHNSKARPPGTLPIPETNYTDSRNSQGNRGGYRGRGTYRGRGRGQRGRGYRGRGSYRGRGRNQGRRNSDDQRNTPDQTDNTTKCYRCGTKGHVKKDCRAPKHLVDLYKQSIAQADTFESHGAFLDAPQLIPQSPETHLILPPEEIPDVDQQCILDSGTSHTILRDRSYFKQITPSQRKVTTIKGQFSLEEGYGPAIIRLPRGTILNIKSAIYAPTATRNLLSFRDIRDNNLHIQTATDKSREVLLLISKTPTHTTVKEVLNALPHGFYTTKTHSYHTGLDNYNATELWHDRLGHPGTTMFYRILKNTTGIPPNVQPKALKAPCMACSKGKITIRPAPPTTVTEIPNFLARLHADVCGPISPASGPFNFFLAMICASSKWSQVSLLSTRNLVFSRILSYILKLKAQFPDHPIKYLRVDNAGEFTSPTFDDFCTTAGINVQYSVAHVHFQNGIAESLIKRLQTIARPILMQTNLPATAWGHAILHAATLLHYRPSAFNASSPHQLAYGTPPNISHLRTFGCQVLVPILGPKRNKMGPQRQTGIYIGNDSPSIIRFMEPTTSDVFKARLADCHFYEKIFPRLETSQQKDKASIEQLKWQTDEGLWLDQRTAQADTEIQRILHLSRILTQMPDAFTDAAKVTRSHIPAENTPARIQLDNTPATATAPRAKRGRPPGATDRTPRQRRPRIPTPTPPQVNEEISINYNTSYKTRDRATTTVNDQFAVEISDEIMENLPDPSTIKAAQKQPDWPEWHEAINAELDSLISRQVFGPITVADPDIHLTGHRWTFVRKRDATGKVVRYKARLVARGFTQIPGRDYDLTYSPVMDITTYRYLIAFSLHHNLSMHQMDIVTAYLYGTLDNTIYMEAPSDLIERVQYHSQGEKSHEPKSKGSFSYTDRSILQATSKEICYKGSRQQTSTRFAVKVLKSMYGLKQSGRTWYIHFKTEMVRMGFQNSEIAPCLFIKHRTTEIIIVAIYVDDLNLFGSKEMINETIIMLKRVFEMRDMGRTTYCLGLQFEHLPGGILLHQSTYIKKILKQFNMHNEKAVRSPMDIRSLDRIKDMFRKRELSEPLLGPEKPYLSAVGALMFAANQTRADISFPISLLARHSKEPTIRHWNGIRRIFRYLVGTLDWGLYFPINNVCTLSGFADAGYLSDPADAKSQTGYIFLAGTTAISWKSSKQTLTTTSSNHSEIIALYEACRECLWLRNVIAHIHTTTGKSSPSNPTIIYEDNQPCIDQLKTGYIKGERTKHIAPKFFFTKEQLGNDIEIEWTPSNKNLADLLTKSLPPNTHRELTHSIGIRSLSVLQEH